MKNTPFISMAIIAVLLVTAVSCTTVQGTQDDYYSNEPVNRRVVMLDPSYNQEVYIVRDAFTGRYYQVIADPYGNRFSNNAFYNDRYYNDRRFNNDRRYNDRYSDSRNRGTNNNTGGATRQQPQPQSSEKINEARKRIQQGN
jgi:hypothetical protein